MYQRRGPVIPFQGQIRESWVVKICICGAWRWFDSLKQEDSAEATEDLILYF